MIYFAHCFIDPSKFGEIGKLKDKHLTYIKELSAQIVYGGVCGTEELPYQSICFYLDVDTKMAARDFVENDPYANVYLRAEINEFVQKIPRFDS